MALWRPRFDRYYSGDWPYESDQGVGLELMGVPLDAGKLVDLLQDVSCNPPAARRILAELQNGRTKRTTVMAGLDFNRIGDRLAEIGVTLRILAPAAPADQRLDQAVFDIVRGRGPALEGLTDAQRDEVAQRVALMRESLVQLPRDFGPYGHC